jgi:hypothetical protein
MMPTAVEQFDEALKGFIVQWLDSHGKADHYCDVTTALAMRGALMAVGGIYSHQLSDQGRQECLAIAGMYRPAVCDKVQRTMVAKGVLQHIGPGGTA